MPARSSFLFCTPGSALSGLCGLAFAAFLAPQILAQDTRVDKAFRAGTGPDGPVYAVAEAPGGKVIIGGMFSAVNGTNRHYIARLLRSGSLDTSFNPRIGADNFVDAIVPNADGTVTIGGYFTRFNDVAADHLVQLASDGNINSIFDLSGGPDDSVYTIVPSGALFFLGGAFTTVDGQIRNGIAEKNEIGLLITFFDPDVEGGPVHAIALRPNGKVLKGGEFGALSRSRRGISQLNTDGSVDQTFDPGSGVNGSVNAIAIQPDGKAIIAGAFTSVNGVTQSNIARLQINGALDTSFRIGSGANAKIRAMIIQDDGKILIGGDFRSFDRQGKAGFARLNSDGSLDQSFQIGMLGFGAVMCLANQADGGVLVGGSFSSLDINGQPYLARLLPTDTDGDGMPDLWEKAHGLDYTRRDDFSDADNDGVTNLQEYLAGTDPQDPHSSPTLRARIMPGALAFSISTAIGKSYQLQQTSSVSSTNWQAAGDLRVGDGQDALFVISTSQADVRVFRIAISDQ